MLVWATLEERKKHCTGFLTNKESEIDDASPGKMDTTWEDACLETMDREA